MKMVTNWESYEDMRKRVEAEKAKKKEAKKETKKTTVKKTVKKDK